MRRPRYADVVGTLALFVALGGTSYAVARNSVGEKQLRTGAVTSSKIRDGAVNAVDLAPGALLAGPRGPRGPEGPAGPAGAPGVAPTAESWQAFPFAAGWTNYGSGWAPAQFRKDQLGRVHLRGLVSNATGAPSSGTIGTLPEGYRPPGNLIFVVQTGEPSGVGRVDVRTGGQVNWVVGQTGEHDYTSLTGISFDTD